MSLPTKCIKCKTDLTKVASIRFSHDGKYENLGSWCRNCEIRYSSILNQWICARIDKRFRVGRLCKSFLDSKTLNCLCSRRRCYSNVFRHDVWVSRHCKGIVVFSRKRNWKTSLF